MDNKAFFKLSYGLYIISSKHGEKQSGCIVNTFQQITNTPPRVAVTLNKENFTTQLIEESQSFHCAVLDQNTDMDIIRRFGFQSGKDINKFEGVETTYDENGMPYIKEHVAAGFTCKIRDQVDVGTHITFISDVENAAVYHDDSVMTYEYYHKVKNGATPKNAPSYQEQQKAGWRCSICGYIYEGETLPADYVCPLCSAPASVFEKV